MQTLQRSCSENIVGHNEDGQKFYKMDKLLLCIRLNLVNKIVA